MGQNRVEQETRARDSHDKELNPPFAGVPSFLPQCSYFGVLPVLEASLSCVVPLPHVPTHTSGEAAAAEVLLIPWWDPTVLFWVCHNPLWFLSLSLQEHQQGTVAVVSSTYLPGKQRVERYLLFSSFQSHLQFVLQKIPHSFRYVVAQYQYMLSAFFPQSFQWKTGRVDKIARSMYLKPF